MNREDYLQAIYRLSIEGGYTANKKIAEALGVSRASVSEMVRKLAEEDLVRLEGTRISLTEDGKMRALHVFKDHLLWESFLTEVLGLDEDTAHNQAHLLEHMMDGKLLQALQDFMEEWGNSKERR